MRLSRYLLAALAALALAGCTDDTTSSSGGGGARLSGQVVKGVTAGAVVTVYLPDGSGGWTTTPRLTTVSGPDGAFAVTLPAGYAGVVKVVASAALPPADPTRMRCDAYNGCGYTPEGWVDDNGSGTIDFGEWYPVAPGFELVASAWVDGTGFRFLNVTPLSTLAASWAATFPQGLNAHSIDIANSRVAALFGLAVSDLDDGVGDLTDPLWRNLADEQQVRVALIYATFAEIAARNGRTPEEFLADLVQYFTDQQGALLQADDGEQPSIHDLLEVTTSLAGIISMPDETRATLESDLQTLLDGLVSGEYTAREIVSIDEILGLLGPMGQQFDEVLGITGLDDPRAFFEEQGPYYGWLLDEGNLQLFDLAIETVFYALQGSIQLDLVEEGTTSMELVNDGLSVITLHVAERTLEISGLRHGQLVDLTVDLDNFLGSLDDGQFAYGVDGTVVNDTAAGEIHGTLSVDAGATDLQPLQAALEAMAAENSMGPFMLKAALLDLAYAFRADIALEGQAQLIRNSDPEQVLGGEVALTAFVDLGAAPDETFARLDVTSASLVLPTGDHLEGLPGQPVLTVIAAHDGTLELDGTGTLFHLPAATAHAEGALLNLRPVFDDIRDVLVNAVDTGNLNLAAIFTDLSNIDYSDLSLQGEGVITIPGLGHQYRASLDDFTGTLYQPWSEDVAATATLDLEQFAVHLTLGDQPWDLRVMTTPTPRLLLLGPDGQFAEATQEDLVALFGGDTVLE